MGKLNSNKQVFIYQITNLPIYQILVIAESLMAAFPKRTTAHSTLLWAAGRLLGLAEGA